MIQKIIVDFYAIREQYELAILDRGENNGSMLLLTYVKSLRL